MKTRSFTRTDRPEKFKDLITHMLISSEQTLKK